MEKTEGKNDIKCWFFKMILKTDKCLKKTDIKENQHISNIRNKIWVINTESTAIRMIIKEHFKQIRTFR